MKTKRAQACDIPKKVKDIVWERDGHKCIICGSYQAMPNSHFIRRSKGGKGIPENIVSMCSVCHRMYDQGIDRAAIETYTRNYLRSHYPDWNESKLIYRKWEDL